MPVDQHCHFTSRQQGQVAFGRECVDAFPFASLAQVLHAAMRQVLDQIRLPCPPRGRAGCDRVGLGERRQEFDRAHRAGLFRHEPDSAWVVEIAP